MKKRVLSAVLALAMVFALLPAEALAAEEKISAQDVVILRFDALAQTEYEVTYGTAQSDVGLPDTLAVSIENGEEEAAAAIVKNVTWSGDYNANQAGVYSLSADAEDYALAEGVIWPSVTVTILSGEPEQPALESTPEPTPEPLPEPNEIDALNAAIDALPEPDEIDALNAAIDALPEPDEIDALIAAIDALPELDYSDVDMEDEEAFAAWLSEQYILYAEVPSLYEQLTPHMDDAAAMERIGAQRADKLTGLYTMLFDAAVMADTSDNWTDHAASRYARGSGTSADPYIIETPAQLAYLSQQANNVTNCKGQYFKLGANIDLSAHYWTPIGHDDDYRKFSGHFDGANYTIYGMNIVAASTINKSGKWLNAGFFGRTESGATIKNVNLVGAVINVDQSMYNQTMNVGGIGGFLPNNEVTNCSFNGVINARFSTSYIMGSSNIYVGGIVGRTSDSSTSYGSHFTDCAAFGAITASSPSVHSCLMGGIGGETSHGRDRGKMLNCYANSTLTNEAVVTSALYLGGVVGYTNMWKESAKMYYRHLGGAEAAFGYIQSSLKQTAATHIQSDDDMITTMKAGLPSWNCSSDVNGGYPIPAALYDMAYNANGGSGDATGKAAFGYPLTLPAAPTRAGYTFTGWHDAASGGTQYEADNAYLRSEGITLYAHWSCNHSWTNTCDTECNTCGESRSITHSWKAATCTLSKTCSVCGATEGSPLGHTLATDAAVAATCTATGLTEGYHCSVCYAVITAQETVPVLGHDYKSVVTAPTCTAQGYTTHTCSRGDSSYVDTYVDATGHTSVTDAAVAATCTATGLTEGSHCSKCDGATVARQTVSALGHDYAGTFTTDTAATCTTAGSQSKHCSRCDSKTEVTAIPATNHAWGDWQSNNNGTETRTCSRDSSHKEKQNSTFTISYAGMDGAAHGEKHPNAHTYGTATAISDPSKTGYTFAGWKVNGATATINLTLASSYYLSGNTTITLTATWTLNAPTVTLTADKNTAASGEKITLTATPSHDLTSGVTYGYEWYKGDAKLEGESSATLALSTVAESGSYTVKVTASDGSQISAQAASSAVSVTISAAHSHDMSTDCGTSSPVTFQKLAATGGTLSSGSYYLDDDVTLTEGLNIPADSTVDLCLNGHALNMGVRGYSVISVESDATLNICDCDSGSETHKFTMSKYYEGKWDLDESAEGTAGVDYRTITGGVITGAASSNGAGMSVYGTVNFYGGTVVGNAATSACVGGGVELAGTLIMSGSSAIIGNYAETGGGGVYLRSGTLTLRDSASICENNTRGSGGGVWITDGALKLSGASRISGNTRYFGRGASLESASNVYLESGKTITVAAPLTGSIGVTTPEPPTAEAPVSITGANSADYSAHFTSDNGNYVIQNGANNTAQLALKTYAITYDKGSGSGDTPSVGTKHHGTDYTVSTSYPLTKTGYTQTGWAASESTDGTGAVTSLSADAAVTLYPVWTVMTPGTPTLTGSDPAAVTYGYTTAPSMTVDVTGQDNTNFNYAYAWHSGNTASGSVLDSDSSYSAPTGLAPGPHSYTVRVTVTNKAGGARTAYADKTFTVTVNNAKITGLTAPEDTTLTDYYTNGEAVKAKLPETAACVSENNGVASLNIVWTAPQSYNTVPGATNSFTWSVSAPANYELAGGVTASGSVTVTNKAATEVSITPANKEITYNNATYDVSAMFTIPNTAGAATYSITPGTGAGTVTDAGILTVAKAGTIKVKVTTAANGNYAEGSAEATLTVNKGSVSVPTIVGKTYTGQPQTADVSETEGDAGYAVTTNEGGTSKGSYNVVLTLNKPDLYQWSDGTTTAATELTFTISQAGNNWEIVLSCDGFTYDGTTALNPTATPKFGTVIYTYAATSNGQYTAIPDGGIKNADTYYIKATVTGNGDYTGLTTDSPVEVTIAKVKLTPSVASVTGREYDGSTDATGTISLAAASGHTMPASETPVASGTFAWANADAGTTTVNVSSIALTNADVNKNYELDTAVLSGKTAPNGAKISAKALDIPAQSLTYNGTTTYEVKNYVTSVGNDEKITLTYTPNAKNVGDYTRAAASNGYTLALSDDNYSVKSAGTLTITSKVLIAPAQTVTYNGGTAFTQEVAGVNNEKVTITYTAYSKNAVGYAFSTEEGEGKYTATSSSANYTVTGGAALTIDSLTATLSWSGDGETTFDGTPRSVTAEVINKVEGDTVTVTVTDGAETNARTTAYTATATALTGGDAANYELPSSKTTTYTIKPKSITGATITLGPALTYNGGEQTQTVAKVEVDNLDATFDVSNNTGTNAKDNYSLTVTGNGNFTGTKTAAWGIAQKDLTITAKAQTITYGDSIATGTGKVEVSSLADGDELDSVTLTPSGSEVAGDKIITPSAAVIKDGATPVTSNYSITYNTGVLTINPATMNPTVIDYTGDYDGAAHGITVTMAGADIKYGTESGAYDQNASPTYTDAGTYPVYYQVTKANHTTVTGSATVNISPKELTADMIGDITAPTYNGGEQMPTPKVSWAPSGGSLLTLEVGEDFTFSYADNINAATSTSDAAPTVTITAVENGNYSGTVSKTFTIQPLTAELTWSGYTGLVYDGEDKTVTATVSNPAKDSDTFSLTYESNTASSAGDYTATVTALGNDNYALPSSPSQVFTIAKAPISFTVADNEYTYNAQPQQATVAQTEEQTPIIGSGKFAVSYKLSSEELAVASAAKTDAGTYAIIVTLTDGNFCFIGEADEDTRSHTLTEKLIIGKKPVTAQWKNLIHAYDKTAKTPEFVINSGDVFSADSGEVRAELGANTKTDAGSYTVTAALTGDRAANYALTNPTGSLIIQKAPVTFAVSGNSVQHDGSGHTATVTATAGGSPFAGFTVSYKNAKGETVGSPTDEGSYDIYAAITGADGDNYRHADAADGATRKIGVLTIYRAAQPQTYTVSFAGGEGATGGVNALPAALSGTPRILPENPENGGFAKDGSRFGGWRYGGRIYQPGEALTQPGANITLTAVWIEATYLIEGVVDEAGNPLADVVVTLMLGHRQIAQTETNEQGKYSFTDVAPGLYNLVVSKNGVTKTILVEIVAGDEKDKNIAMPAQKTNSVVEVAAGSPAIVVGELEKTFSPEDVEAAKIGSVEMKLTAEAVTENADGTAIESKAGGTVGLLLDVTLTKTVIKADGTTDSDASGELKESPALLQIIIQLPGELQGKDAYTVYRVHEGVTEALTSSPNDKGEHIEVNGGKTSITVYAKYFSIYAIAFTTYSGGGTATTYKPIIMPTEHGSIAVRPAASVAGAKVAITLSPDEGYEPASVKVTDRNGKEIALTPNNGGKYSFTQPVGSVTITARFRAAWNPFADVKQGNWFHDDVRYVYERELMQGTGETTFSPHADTSRGMIVTILWRMENEPKATEAMTFTDVAEGKYYYDAIAWAAEHGIVEGYDALTFGPDNPITREQMAAILYRYAKYKGYDVTATADLSKFTDADKIGSWATTVLSWANTNEFITGKGNHILDPQGSAERCQVAAILHRFCENIVK